MTRQDIFRIVLKPYMEQQLGKKTSNHLAISRDLVWLLRMHGQLVKTNSPQQCLERFQMLVSNLSKTQLKPPPEECLLLDKKILAQYLLPATCSTISRA